MTKQRAWPNNAAYARDESAELLAEAERFLEPLTEGKPMLREEIAWRSAMAQRNIQKALRLLESVGAQTRP